MKISRRMGNVFALLAIVFMLLSLIPLTRFARNKTFGRENIMGFYAEEPDSLDMVYIGGSACFSYWIPLRAWNRYGFTSYNFAVEGLSPVAIKYFFKEVEKTQTPRLWVVDLRPFQYGDEWNEEEGVVRAYVDASIRSGIDSMKYSENRNDLIRASVPNPKDRISYFFDFIKYHSQLSKRFIRLISDLYKSKSFEPFKMFLSVKPNAYKGYAFWEATIPVNYNRQNTKRELPLSDSMNGLLKDLLEFCTSEKLNVLFIVHSYCETEEDKMKYNYMKNVIENYGFGFLDTNDYYLEMNLDYDFDFYNTNHVNVFGAEKYTDFLASHIKKNYIMPDHRNDSSFIEWNNLYTLFERKTFEAKKVISEYNQEQCGRE